MALAKAVGLGLVAAIAAPTIMRHLVNYWGGFIATTTHVFYVGGHALHWNWPLFCVVTLAAWGLFKAAESG